MELCVGPAEYLLGTAFGYLLQNLIMFVLLVAICRRRR